MEFGKMMGFVVGGILENCRVRRCQGKITAGSIGENCQKNYQPPEKNLFAMPLAQNASSGFALRTYLGTLPNGEQNETMWRFLMKQVGKIL